MLTVSLHGVKPTAKVLEERGFPEMEGAADRSFCVSA